ncbi:alpha/beta fold hydrolase [Nocardia flavorosea]|uniref:alpha/beta fold hydrolase n=1 Tax=Nocardia flavorosea TaxID=53429 RepID=UPI000B186832|nr:alpha/beta fold hydrolase [Nocardia flavorosea]
MSEGVTVLPETTEELEPLGPDSVAWSVFGELTFVLGASRRLLIDVAHPVVATGVREFSVFETDPYGRAERTLDMIMGVVYGRDEALATARKLRNLHKDFKGRNADGTRWSALNPEAFHWVHASLVHGVYTQQKVLGRGWKSGEVEQFYREMRQVGRFYGVREQDMPVDWAAFCAWFDEMTATELERCDVTDRVLAVVGRPTPPPMIPVLRRPIVWNYTVRPIAGRVLTLVTAGLLTPELRELLGVRWNRPRRIAFDVLAAVSRAVLPRLPRIVRQVPQARRAVRRARRSRAAVGQEAVMPEPDEVRQVRSADGTRLHVEIHGRADAPTIVLTHGVLCSLGFWRRQITDLRAGHRVVAFDHRGHGRSEVARRGRYTVEHLADDLHAVLAETVPAGRPAVLAGHSMGGIAILAWANRYPGDIAARARAVALVNTTPGEILDNVRFLRGPERLLGARRRVARTVAPLAGIPLPRRMPVRRRLLAHIAVGATAAPRIGHELDRIIGATSARGRGGYGAMLVNLVTALDPAALTVPTVVLAGRKDKIAPLARSQLIAAALPQLIALHELDSGHCAPLECADEVTAALRELSRDRGESISSPVETA